MIPAYLTQSRETLETESRRHYQTAYLGDGIILCRVLGRYLMRADARDLDITPHLCLDGFWESWVTLAIAARLRAGMRCVDVGANHGYYTLLMADAVGEEGQVLALEPNPALADLVRVNANTNGLGDRVAVIERAASARADELVELVMPPAHAATASICRPPASGDRRLQVLTTTVDEAVSGWPRVDLIKIDAEGAEPAIWSGMQATVRANPDLIVFLELTPSAYADPRGFLRTIQASGHRLRYVETDGSLRATSVDELLAPSHGPEPSPGIAPQVVPEVTPEVTGAGTRWQMLCLSRD